MEAAAHGHSTLGIPKSVGQEFVAADKGKATANKYANRHASKLKKRGLISPKTAQRHKM